MKTIVFTGGPNSGKTKLISKLRKQLRNKDYSVITVREAAREVIKQGNLFNFKFKFLFGI